MNIKEIEPTTQKNIHENIFEEELNIVIDELVNIYFKELNEGKERKVRRQNTLNYIENNYKINLQEIISWLLNNQNDSNSIFWYGYFNFHGIGININKQKAFELFQKAANLENNIAQFDLANMYIDGDIIDKNYVKAFELSEKLAKKGYPCGINLLGYCYDIGIGIEIDKEKAFELYLKTANLGNCLAQYNLALMYEFGNGIEQDVKKAIYWYKKSAEQGDEDALIKLKALSNE
jgi:TPR repeat protein